MSRRTVRMVTSACMAAFALALFAIAGLAAEKKPNPKDAGTAPARGTPAWR